ncbi:ribonuclease H-like domain-containing protein [Tanacetum coccineum]
MEMTQLDVTIPRWSVTTATRWDTLQGNAEDLGTKIAETESDNTERLEVPTPEFEDYKKPKTIRQCSEGHPQKEDQGYVDSGILQAMTGNMSHPLRLQGKFDGGKYLGGGAKVGKLQMCDKKNSVLFTDTGCFVLSPEFKLADESQVLLKVPRKNNMYSVDMKNIISKECLTCLVAKATLDESMLWHRRLVQVVAGTNSNDYVGTEESIGTSHSSKETGSSQDYILMLIWKEEEPKKVIQALKDPRWIEAMQEELLHFKNKKDARGIVIRNKARLVAHGYTQEEGIDYDKLIQKLRQKGVYEESFSRHAAWIGGKLIQLMHTTMVPEQVKTMKIQAGIQVSRPRELTRQLQLWKRFGRLYLIVFVLVRNITPSSATHSIHKQWSMLASTLSMRELFLKTYVTQTCGHTTNLCYLDTTRHLAAAAADTAVVAVGTADNIDHIAAEHNQVGCRLPAVEHCKPHPYAQTLTGTCPSDMTAYTLSSL